MHLFNSGEFPLHAGECSSFKIDCDALTDDDLAALAIQVAARFRWREVHGIPRGGQRFAAALQEYSVPALELPRLIVDDVYTTGSSMQPHHLGGALGVVIFARREPPQWIHPIFRLWSPITPSL